MIALSIVLAVCVVLTLHLFTTYPLSLMLVRRFSHPKREVGKEPESFAVVCCMLNQRSVVDAKIRNMHEIAKRLKPCQLLLHSDASTDGTNDVLLANKDTITVSISPIRQGKSVGMNTLLSMTEAEIVYFHGRQRYHRPERRRLRQESVLGPHGRLRHRLPAVRQRR
jgi:hypothetical protein